MAGMRTLLSRPVLAVAPVLALVATNCQTGDSIAHEQAEVKGKESVLGALGTMASRLRGTLGESLASIEKFGTRR